nr:hypothetical protein [Tanacetum cinerariifolium]
MELYNECGRSQHAKVVRRYWERHRCQVVDRVVVAAAVVKVEAGRARLSANLMISFRLPLKFQFLESSTTYSGSAGVKNSKHSHVTQRNTPIITPNVYRQNNKRPDINSR